MPKKKLAENSELQEADVPRVIVFDLDGTLWNPEMYQLRGGAPFRPDTANPDVMIDRSGEKVRLIGETRRILQEFITDLKWKNTYLAVSSTCDEPQWAAELLQHYKFTDSKGGVVTMGSLFGDLKEIYYSGKDSHHKKILEKINRLDKTVTDFSQMLFFDNQMNNIRSVSDIGVTSCYCPSGMIAGAFEKGIQMWQLNKSSL